MTTSDEVHDQVAETDPDDWIPFTDLGSWTCKEDVRLRIQRHERLDANLQTPWTQHLQSKSESYSYIIYYGDSPVEYHVIASVDNFRAHIPMPQQPQGPNEPFTITPFQANLGQIITGDGQTFDAYLNNTGIQVQE